MSMKKIGIIITPIKRIILVKLKKPTKNIKLIISL